MRIIIATGDMHLRLAAELLLSEEPGLDIVGTVSDSKGLLSLIATNTPNLVLLDWDLPDRPVEIVMPEIKRWAADTKIIVIGLRESDKDTALQNGAEDFLLKGDPPEKLKGAIKRQWSHYKNNEYTDFSKSVK